MAGVFLSYDRDDTDKARSLAHAIEKAGHHVWWDLHVRGGAQFSKVIEEALRAADVVVVLWSAKSVESAWVRDEAAAGRDSGRLVPVTTDGTDPPLGFRQFQTIDLSGWKGRIPSAGLRTLLQDIASVVAVPAPPRSDWGLQGQSTLRERLRWPVVATGGVVLVVLLVSLAVWHPWNSGASVPTVLVTAGRNDGASQSLAGDLAVQLARMPITQSGSLRLVTPTDGASEKPQLVLDASSQNGAQSSSATLLLKNAADGAVVWSQDFEQGNRSPTDVNLQMALTAADVLGCAADALADNGKRLSRQSQGIYLSSCSQTAESPVYDEPTVVAGLSKVVAQAPRFTPAWRKLLVAEAGLFEDGDQGSSQREILRKHIAAARRLDPDMPEAIVAEIALTPPTDLVTRLKLIDQAYRKYPDNPDIMIRRTALLEDVGRMRDALGSAVTAIEVDPNSPAVLSSYITALSISGQADIAEQQLKHAERLWPGTSALDDMEWNFYFRFGDPRIGLQMASNRSVSPSMLLFLEARAAPTTENIDKLINFYVDRSRNGENLASLDMLMQAFGQFHREDQLYPIMLHWPNAGEFARLGDVWFRPALHEFRRDPRFMQVAARSALLKYWRATGKWPDFCFEPNLPYDCKREAARIST